MPTIELKRSVTVHYLNGLYYYSPLVKNSQGKLKPIEIESIANNIEELGQCLDGISNKKESKFFPEGYEDSLRFDILYFEKWINITPFGKHRSYKSMTFGWRLNRPRHFDLPITSFEIAKIIEEAKIELGE